MAEIRITRGEIENMLGRELPSCERIINVNGSIIGACGLPVHEPRAVPKGPFNIKIVGDNSIGYSIEPISLSKLKEVIEQTGVRSYEIVKSGQNYLDDDVLVQLYYAG